MMSQDLAGTIASEGFASAGFVMPEAHTLTATLSDLPAYQCHTEYVAVKDNLPLLQPDLIDPANHYACYRLRDYIEHPAVLRLLFNEELHAIADQYLGQGHLAAVICWRTLANPKRAMVAQRLHRDGDKGRSLALFIYLNDVSLEQGPHVYVRRSHKLATFFNELCAIEQLDDEKRAEILHYSFFRDGNDYEMDEAMAKFAPHLLHVQTGKEGTGLFTEPRGLHRGNPVLSGSRLMLSLRWHPGFGRPPKGDNLNSSVKAAISSARSKHIAANLQTIYDQLYAKPSMTARIGKTLGFSTR